MRASSLLSAVVRVDRAGLWLATACAVHCLCMPLLLAALPFLAIRKEILGSLESVFVVTSVTLAAVNLCWGVRIHRAKGLFLLLGTAVALIVAGKLFAAGPGETLLIAGGALGIAASHLLNRRLCLSCSHCEDRRHSHS